MGFNIGQTVETNLVGWNDNQDWLASAHAVDTGDTITLDGPGCRAVFADGVVPSGCPMGVNASGRYIPGDGTGAAAKRVHLLFTVQVGATPNATLDLFAGAGLWHGEIVRAKLPAGVTFTDRAQCRYV